MLRGAESLDFLNRLSTHDLKELGQGRIRPTILTTDKARIIDLVLVLDRGDQIMLIVSEGNSATIMSWLEKYIIMEEISITDVTASYKSVSVLGPQAASIASHLAGTDVNALTGSISRLADGTDLFLYRNPLWTLPVYDIVGNPKAVDLLADRLQRPSGGDDGAPGVASGVIDVLRVETGIPQSGKEITDQVNPLEAGLARYVSFTKGCYIGQEVIARIDTYRKLQRNLRGFVFPQGYTDRTPGKLLFDGTEVGWTTSHVLSHEMGKQIALGYLKVFPEMSTVGFRKAGSTSDLSLEVVDLPFVSAAPKSGAAA